MGEKVVPDTRPGMPPLGEDGELYTAIAEAIAAAKYDNPLHKALVYWYVHMEGQPFPLSMDHMRQRDLTWEQTPEPVRAASSPSSRIGCNRSRSSFRKFPTSTVAEASAPR